MNSNQIIRFNPFESRRCRTVRNALGQSLLTAIETGEWEPVSRVAQKDLSADAGKVLSRYVKKRVASYENVFSSLHSNATPADDTWPVALSLWDQALFFECHEWLEKKWHRSKGTEKKMLQVLIWAAGVYAHLEYGRTVAAGKLAVRAISGLKDFQEKGLYPFDVAVLVRKLEALDPVSPKLGSNP